MDKVFLQVQLVFALCAVGLGFSSEVTNSAPNPQSPSGAKESAAASSIEAAFRRGLGSIKEQVNLLDPKGSISVTRTEGAWLICLTNYADLPERFLAMSVFDQGPIKYRFAPAVTTADSTKWFKTSRKTTRQANEVVMRPEVAFRKGLGALVQWRIHDASKLNNEQGRITLSPDSDGWIMDVFGYPGLGLGGWWITIRTNGEVAVRSGI